MSWRFRPQCIPDRRIGGPGHYVDHANSLWTQLFAQSISETERSVLRGVVGSRSGEDLLGCDRQIIYDRAAALHHGQRRLGYQKEAVEVGVDYFCPSRVGQLAHGSIGMANAGVV